MVVWLVYVEPGYYRDGLPSEELNLIMHQLYSQSADVALVYVATLHCNVSLVF